MGVLILVLESFHHPDLSVPLPNFWTNFWTCVFRNTQDGSRFWFRVPFRENGIKKIGFDKPQRFRAKWNFFRLRTIFSTKFTWKPFRTSNNAKWWEVGRWTFVCRCDERLTERGCLLWIKKARVKDENLFLNVGVMNDDKDEVNRREVCECEWWVWKCEKLRVIHSSDTLGCL